MSTSWRTFDKIFEHCFTKPSCGLMDPCCRVSGENTYARARFASSVYILPPPLPICFKHQLKNVRARRLIPVAAIINNWAGGILVGAGPVKAIDSHGVRGLPITDVMLQRPVSGVQF